MSDYIKRDIKRIIANAQECDIDALTWEEQKERLKAVKSADVAPVRHGRWMDMKGFWMCSECHKDTLNLFSYCPYCGAKMDEEE